MIPPLVRSVRDAAFLVARRVAAFVRAVTRPADAVVGVLGDLSRTRADLPAESILLRQQRIVASRVTTRPKSRCTSAGWPFWQPA